ncbi:MAG: hypothetical protein J1E63_08820, partial [Muribaculaceae bacterium]|nr:hypothetical protein [Muribaculaceae bacterium]
MKKFFTLCLATFAGLTAMGETILVDFESGFPTDWSQTGVTVKKDNNSNRAAMGANATMTSPAIGGLRSVAYKHRGSGSNKELVVDASADGGKTWTNIGSTKVSSASAYGSSSHTVATADSPVQIRFTCKSATIYVDDIELVYQVLAAEPTTVSTLKAADITGNSATVSIAKGNGDGRLVAIAAGSSLGWAPEDGTAYTGTFPKRAGDVTILAAGDIDTATATGLEPGKTYTIGVFEYNGEGEAVNYLTAGANTLTVTTLTVPTLTVSPATVDFRKTRVGGYKESVVALTGSYLNPVSGKITVTSADDNVTLSADGGTTYSNSVAIDYSDATAAGSVIIRFTPEAYGEFATTVAITGGGTSATIDVKGIGADNDNHEYFIAPDGDDNADGSINAPWLNLQKAVNAALPGDVIYCRGGRYNFTTRDSSGKLTVRIKNSGTADAPITITAYPGEHPIFDFEQQLLDCKRDRSKVGDRGILLTGNYWHLYGLHIMHAADNGLKLEGSHNRIERCEFSYNLDSGLQMGFGHNFADSGLGSKNDGSFCAYNDIIDCDSHHNCDYDSNYGSDADGFACKMHNGIGNRFIRCRAWRNGDDAWDLYETDYSVVLIECWAWHSGKAEDHTWVYDYFDQGPGFSGNGNGIKLGGNGSGGSSRGVHYAYNCIAFGNDKSGSTKGFDCNSHKDGHVIVGGLAFDNGYDFMFESGGGANSEFYNNVCFGRQEILVGTESNNALGGMTPNAGKTFYNNVVTGFSRSDYESLSEADALAPRGEDGSLPVKFGRLKSGSKLVDAGLDKPVPHTDEFPALYQPIYGKGRDIGPYELAEGQAASVSQLIADHNASTSFEMMATGRDGETVAVVSTDSDAAVTLTISNIAGARQASVDLGTVPAGTVYYHPVAT